ncbi:MAG TPA: hypothetical protein DEA50_05425, partial [Parvularcula sp.]|nr:hypothetical protein [Parvularcula sp.]
KAPFRTPKRRLLGLDPARELEFSEISESRKAPFRAASRICERENPVADCRRKFIGRAALSH